MYIEYYTVMFYMQFLLNRTPVTPINIYRTKCIIAHKGIYFYYFDCIMN